MNPIIISAVHTEHQTIRLKTPLMFTPQKTEEEGIYHIEWPEMGFGVTGDEKVVQYKILEFIVNIYNLYVEGNYDNIDMLRQKRIEALFV